ncbi:hypothetical protein IPV69_24150 [Humisphaera borealis]|uniref:Calx-beta domain-containing protein n=1 Tax=Humisphaera borealis TaxID=2807512 RepID=A0A7M2WVB7_9BACT|nr:hypothetical protein IPV69_24150 [Humisphaera borealis]
MSTPRCVVETLECRQLLSASLQVENLDVIPGYERMVFTKIGNPDETTPNKVKETGVLKLRNIGDEPLTFSNITFSGPFKVVGSFPTSIAPGGSAEVTLQFTATSTPTYTYNQTSGITEPRRGGAHIGSLTFKTNDPANPTFTEGLAGWYQVYSERNNEPGLQTIVNLLLDYKTVIAPPKTVLLEQADTPKYYGEEVVSAYWNRANPAKSVSVRQIAAYHGQGNDVPIYWHSQGGANNLLFRHDGAASQTLLPNILGGTGAAAGSFSTNSTFGFRVDNSYSDDTRNKKPEYGGGHEIRFFPVRDHFGNVLANTYFLVQDYAVPVNGSPPNFDFQDNLYIVTNITPANGAVPPPVTVPPVVPPVVPPTVPPEVPPTVPPTVPPVVPPTVPPTVPPVVTVPPTVPPSVPPPPPIVIEPVPPTISLSPPAMSVVEGLKGKQKVELTISLSQPVSYKTKVRFSTTDIEAKRGSDYTGKATGVIKFGVGQTTKTIKMLVKSDKVAEASESFMVTLSEPSNAQIGTAQSTVTIQDNGVQPTTGGGKAIPAEGTDLPIVSITSAVPLLAEGNTGVQLYAFNVAVDRAPLKKVTLKYAAASGTATKGSDFKPKSGSLVFAPGGPTTRTITVAVKGDTVAEPDEAFIVSLFAIKNGVFATDSAQGIIQNDDA